MAKVVLGIAVPHSGMLGKPAETWPEDGDRDRRKPYLWFQNKQWTYEQLREHRRHEHLERFLTVDELRARGARCAKALDELRRIYRAHKPDIAVIIGKDQKEIFIDHSPSLAIYTGEKIPNGPPQRAVYAPDKPVTYDGHPDLALHLIKALQGGGFDMVDLFNWPANTWMKPPGPVVPHAFGFIYRQIMEDQPPPSVPVLMNTFYAPTQPSFERSLSFGKALYEAIKSWESEKKVAIIASGGLSHFVCDEELDQVFLESFRNFDFDRLGRIDENSYQHGTSEVKLYVSVLWAMRELGCETNIIDYVPCYRTEAGSGEGFGFFSWVPR